MNEVLQYGRAASIWDVLILKAEEAETITYKALSDQINVHHRGIFSLALGKLTLKRFERTVEVINTLAMLGRKPQRLAQTRPGARGALLLEACVPAAEFGDVAHILVYSSNARTREQVRLALGRIGGPEAAPAVVEVLHRIGVA